MPLNAPQQRLLAWLAIAAAGAALLWLLAPVLVPFLIGAVLAYALWPAVRWLIERRMPAVLAVAVVELLVIAIVLALALLIVPILAKELPLLRDQIPTLAERANAALAPLLAHLGLPAALDIASVKAFVLKYLGANAEDWIATALASARIGGSLLLSVVGNAVLIPVVLFYLLLDWPRLVAGVTSAVPPRLRGPYLAFLGDCDAVLGQYLRGQVVVMLALAVYYSLGLALFGFDLAVPVGVFTGLLVFVPYVGFGVGLLLALLAGVLQFGVTKAMVAVAVVYGLGQLLEGFVLTPKLIGERIGLNPLMVLFLLLAFGHLFGFAGVLVALPVGAVLVVAARRLQTAYVASPLYRATDG